MITDYASLQAEIAEWLARESDAEFTAQIPIFIQLAEEAIGQSLKGRHVQTRAWAILNEQYEWLPEDFASMAFCGFAGPVNGGSTKQYPMTVLTPEQFNIRDLNPDGSRASFYTIIGPQIGVTPFEVVDSTDPDDFNRLSLVYYRKPPALSDTVTTNFVLDNYPTIYLYGSLLQAVGYNHDLREVPLWATAYQQAIDRANAEASDAGGIGTTYAAPGVAVV